MQYRGGRNGGARFLLRPIEGGGHKHAETQHAGILHFQPHLRGAKIGIHDRPDVADPALESQVRVGIQVNVSVLADSHKAQIVLIHVAENPNVRQVGNREGIRS